MPMSASIPSTPRNHPSTRWLPAYYLSRAAASAVWIGIVLSVGRSMPPVAAALLVAYPAIDSIANLLDARRNGGVARNPSQALNSAASALVALAVLAALHRPNSILVVLGVWAALAGLLQLATGVRRWRHHGAQWAMILSGAQSTLAGAFFVRQALLAPLSVTDTAAKLVGYAGFGAFYFLLSGVWLLIRRQEKDIPARRV
ncbi:hypothetical protein [Rhizosaccharibacter radicis]|uniref:DUF308 domain-containing protein n=1 Tax=Rhizosaccharibacter radicis TaxID=2782605 RepID=A0ABT1VUI5_9PROT|nr:DUF308 domain-containing protein [Acetobacteraceae bacterium KSS12]